jgi:hypothetical protein
MQENHVFKYFNFFKNMASEEGNTCAVTPIFHLNSTARALVLVKPFAFPGNEDRKE